LNLSDKHINPQLLGKIKQISHAYDIPALVKGIENRDRNSIAQAITLVESNRAEDQEASIELLSSLQIKKQGFRIIITGAPGVGKSTFVSALARKVINEGSSMAILATDPTSQITGGSILGDKTRMGEILSSDQIFVRPSASSNHLGGATKNSLEKIDILHAAGFDYIVLETVGVGQSEFSTYKLSD